MDPRHLRRIKIIQELYRITFLNEKKSKILTVNKILLNINEIDNYIKSFAIKLSFEKISKIDLAILRLAIYELIIEKKQPVKVIINEAVELAKEFGGENSYKFINGLLGKVVSSIKI